MKNQKLPKKFWQTPKIANILNPHNKKSQKLKVSFKDKQKFKQEKSNKFE